MRMRKSSKVLPWRSPRVWLMPPLLIAAVWYANPSTLLSILSRADPFLVTLAIVISVIAHFLSAARWAAIARGLGLVAPNRRLVPIYARGITTNMLLPGGTLSGDLLRSVQLARLGNPFVCCALSVFLDRFSGLWVLCVLSLLAAAGVALWGSAQVAHDQMLVYLLTLSGLAAGPFIPLPVEAMRRSHIAWVAALAARWEQVCERLRQARPALVSSIWQSLAVQLLFATTLWVCGVAVGVSVSYPVMVAAAAPIFIVASLPVGVAGFGTREVAAAIVLGLAGVPADLAVAAALLFGITIVLQGVLAAPLFLTAAS
jgi:glycosyltransferase 2 family protein